MKHPAAPLAASLLWASALFTASTYADGNSIGKIYDPYVRLLEQELEVRSIIQRDANPNLDDRERYSVGYGRTISDQWFAETYLIGHQGPDDTLNLDAIELEFKYQISEQGEFANDWGLLLELERATTNNTWETSTGIIMVHEWPRWLATVNLFLIYEWGRGFDNELETSFAGQLRYRYRQTLEPALELHLSQNTRAIGPALSGALKLGGRQRLYWDAGLMFGQDSETPDTTLRLSIEYEF